MNLEPLRSRRTTDSLCFHTTKCKPLLTFRIFSWTFMLNSCSRINSSFDVSGKLSNLSSTNLSWEQQKAYVLLSTYTNLQNVNFYTPTSLISISQWNFSTFSLLAAKSFASCCTLCGVSYSQLFQHHFSFFYLFSGVFVGKLAIGEDKLEIFDIFLLTWT